MLRIPLGQLESARANPNNFAHALAAKNNSQRGSQGFVGRWKSVIRNYHENNESVDVSLEKLDNTLYAAFKDNRANKERRSKFWKVSGVTPMLSLN